ncbi:MAG TPA: succinate dehydrogenase assembly factor 2 [Steroidobacteraceae bacterium]|jgi:antitoxin CptB|nr:succinate dehydrogenase assembly factor 2 [Steroidobacteraceae bacterium]
MSEVTDPERGRLAWRCRRGRREWDLLLLDWIGRHYDSTTPAQRARFAAVLDLSEPELEYYLLTAEHPLQADLPEPPKGRNLRPPGESKLR